MLLLLLACTGSSEKGEDSGFCSDAPTVTYETFGKGFLTENCQSCHASTSPNRNDAPEDVTFDTVDEVWALSDRILARAAAEPPTMPPMAGTSEDDRLLLRYWLTCGTPGE
jgi:uncharacterized membrane protein